MPVKPSRLPPARLAPLAGAYAAVQWNRRLRLLLALGVLAALTLLSAWVAQVDLPRLLTHIGRFFGYFDRLLTLEGGDAAGQRVWTDPGEWFWGLHHWLPLLADTVLMAAVGTLLGTAAGTALGFASADNMVRNPWLRHMAKRLLEFCRTVPEIVFALIFVLAFGLGPFPGVLAIAVHSLGGLGKQFSEAVENIDMKPVEGAIAAGATWPAMVCFGALPQVLPSLASYALLRFEINVRGASVLGFVGAGGIGQDLLEAIRKFHYSDVSALLVLIIATVVVIDLLTSRLRARLAGMERAA